MNRLGSNQPDSDSSKLYYYDDTISVTKSMVTLGHPYNQAFNLATIHGVSHGRDNSGMIVRLMWFLLGVFGLMIGAFLLFDDQTFSAFLVSLISIGISWLAIRGSGRPFVELKFGGLNNQMLYMKRMDGAEALAVAIKMAMHDLNTPPDPGQSVQLSPIFPDPVLSRN